MSQITFPFHKDYMIFYDILNIHHTIYSSINGCMNCFHRLVNGNNLQWTWVQISLWDIIIDLHSFEYAPRNRIDGLKIVLFFIFGGITLLFSIMVVPKYFPPRVQKGSLFSTSLPLLFIFYHFDNYHT